MSSLLPGAAGTLAARTSALKRKKREDHFRTLNQVNLKDKQVLIIMMVKMKIMMMTVVVIFTLDTFIGI